VDGHLHIESTLLSPPEFAKVVVPHGTTSVITDPHEIANVEGLSGIRYMLDASKDLPLDIYIMLPSCVPSTTLETSGAKLNAKSLSKYINHPKVIGIGEVMDYPAVIAAKRNILSKILLVSEKRIGGHAPSLSGKDLYAYISANISSDHECTKAKEAQEKLMAGLHIAIREGTAEKNLQELAKILTPANSHRCFFCSDDISPNDLLELGHIDGILRRAVKFKISPITALQMATNNAPSYYRLPIKKGAVAVGYAADLVVFDNLKKFDVRLVFKDGILVAKDGELVDTCEYRSKIKYQNTIRLGKITPQDLKLWTNKKWARVIGLIPGRIVTEERLLQIKSRKGAVHSDISRDILKLAVFERHKFTGRVGVGFVQGFGLKKGALASTISHDSHNIIVVGTNDEDMLKAVHVLAKTGGGIVAVAGDKIIALLELPIAGLMSNENVKMVVRKYEALQRAGMQMGSKLKDPFLQLSFLSLPVIPKLKLTDKGLVDSDSFKLVPLFI